MGSSLLLRVGLGGYHNSAGVRSYGESAGYACTKIISGDLFPEGVQARPPPNKTESWRKPPVRKLIFSKI